MREIIARENSGLVPLQDQAHVADLLMEDIGKIKWAKTILHKVCSVVNYVQSRYLLRALCNKYKDNFNKSEAVSTGNVPTAKSFSTPAATRFAYAHKTLQVAANNRIALRNADDSPEFRDAAPVQASSKRECQAEFRAIVNDTNFWVSVRELVSILEPALMYLRYFDGPDPKQQAVFPLTTQLLATYNSICPQDVPPEFLTSLLEVVRLRSYGAPTGRTRIRVILLQSFHYLASFLNPTSHPEQMGQMFANGIKALEYFVGSNMIFSQRMIGETAPANCLRLLQAQMSSFKMKDGSFAAGESQRSNVDPVAWWLCFGGSCLELRKIASFALPVPFVLPC
jgi:hypothetical protein